MFVREALMIGVVEPVLVSTVDEVWAGRHLHESARCSYLLPAAVMRLRRARHVPGNVAERGYSVAPNRLERVLHVVISCLLSSIRGAVARRASEDVSGTATGRGVGYEL